MAHPNPFMVGDRVKLELMWDDIWRGVVIGRTADQAECLVNWSDSHKATLIDYRYLEPIATPSETHEVGRRRA